MEVVEAAVIEALIKRAEAIANLAQVADESPSPNTPELNQLQTQLFSLKSIPGNNPAIAAAISQIESEITQLRYSLSQSKKMNSGSRDLLLWAFSDPDYWRGATDEDRKRVYRELVDKVVVKDGKVLSVSLKI